MPRYPLDAEALLIIEVEGCSVAEQDWICLGKHRRAVRAVRIR